MGQVRRTLLEVLQGKKIESTVSQRVENLPPVQTDQGWEIQPDRVAFFFVGDRIARVCLDGCYLTGPFAGDPNASTSAYFEGWDKVPEDVAEALEANFPA